MPFDKVLIANRGEIAVRVMSACKDLDVETVAIYSDADIDAGHVRFADEAYNIGPAQAADSYLDQDAILDIAVQANADAIHPGYGFLAENSEFAQKVEETDGLTWVGPSSDAMTQLGEKTKARKAMQAADVPIVPGTTDSVESVDEIADFADENGYPVAIKAEGGGGGRGMKVVRSPEEAQEQLESAKREGKAYFDNDSVYLERYLDDPRHIEIQVLADAHGNVRHLGERDCSLQRRHQKIIEEAPSPTLSADLRERIADAARRGVDITNYTNAGTVEFLVEDGEFYFLEVNTRIQVEHTVSEEITGIDIVKWQLRIAAGEELSFEQEDIMFTGHAMEFRINAENTAEEFTPETGTLAIYDPPGGIGVRVDDAVRQGDVIGGDYDSMIGKLIVRGADRTECLARSRRAFEDFGVDGVVTTVPFHRMILTDERFVEGTHTTNYLDEELEQSKIESVQEQWGTESNASDPSEDYVNHDLLVEMGSRRFEMTLYQKESDIRFGLHQASSNPDGDRTPGGTAGQSEVSGNGFLNTSDDDRANSTGMATSDDSKRVEAEMQGTILTTNVEVGDEVEHGDVVCVLEAMKMENDIVTQHSGTVTEVGISEGESVDIGDLLVSLD